MHDNLCDRIREIDVYIPKKTSNLQSTIISFILIFIPVLPIFSQIQIFRSCVSLCVINYFSFPLSLSSYLLDHAFFLPLSLFLPLFIHVLSLSLSCSTFSSFSKYSYFLMEYVRNSHIPLITKVFIFFISMHCFKFSITIHPLFSITTMIAS